MNVTPRKWYVVTTDSECVVTDANGKVLCTATAGEQKLFYATTPVVTLSDETATVGEANFKRALAALGLLGGGNTSGLPAGYTRVEFLESTGTQYVRLPKLEVNNNDTIKSEYVLTGYKDAAANGLFAIVGYDSGQYLRLYTTRNTDINGRATGYKFGTAGLSKSLPERELIKFEITKDGCVVNGVQYDNLNTLEFSYSDMLLFNQYVIGQYWPSLVRFYKFSVSQKCKLQPALDPTGTPCMFDLVTRKPFFNSGTGDFLYPGKEKQATTYSLRRPRMYAQMTEHGIRRLYHVPKGYNGTPEEYAAQNGFKILVETPAPEEGCWAPVWHEREDCIELEWVETEPPTDEELLTVS
jgi:hypothetical protein